MDGSCLVSSRGMAFSLEQRLVFLDVGHNVSYGYRTVAVRLEVHFNHTQAA
eukprot:m.26329 g.26329  ORF g.26329 m.26329 type:complete len:51 (-) comp11688_c0_seq2:40-192(-)